MLGCFLPVPVAFGRPATSGRENLRENGVDTEKRWTYIGSIDGAAADAVGSEVSSDNPAFRPEQSGRAVCPLEASIV
jgi:hypothetical protein